MSKFIHTAAAALLAAGSAHAAVTVSVEAAGVENTTVALSAVGVETFDAAPGGYVSPLATTFGGSSFAGSFDGLIIGGANVYGGAGGTGQFVTTTGETVLSLASGTTDYFGLWASALDGGNAVAFYKGGTLIDTISLVGYPLDDSYRGNPSGPFAGGNTNEKYAFFNFVIGGGYDEVHLIQNNGGGFELDNVTVGTTAPVPEPATWTLMIGGFLMTGLGVRRRKTATA